MLPWLPGAASDADVYMYLKNRGGRDSNKQTPKRKKRTNSGLEGKEMTGKMLSFSEQNAEGRITFWQERLALACCSQKLGRLPRVTRFQVNLSHLFCGAHLDLGRFRITQVLLSEEIWQKSWQLSAPLAVTLDQDLFRRREPKRFHCWRWRHVAFFSLFFGPTFELCDSF